MRCCPIEGCYGFKPHIALFLDQAILRLPEPGRFLYVLLPLTWTITHLVTLWVRLYSEPFCAAIAASASPFSQALSVPRYRARSK